MLDRYYRLIYANDSAKALLNGADQRAVDVREWLPEVLTTRMGDVVNVQELFDAAQVGGPPLLLLRS